MDNLLESEWLERKLHLGRDCQAIKTKLISHLGLVYKGNK
jgi:hypothetical protein